MARLVVSILGLIVVGCTGLNLDGQPPDGSGSARPPDLIVSSGDQAITLSPYSYCFLEQGQGVCADGAPPDPLSRIDLDEESGLNVFYPLEWTLTATLLTDGDFCSGQLRFDVSDGAFPPALGPAGIHVAEIFGRGGPGEDAAFAFELVTTGDQPGPPIGVTALWYPGAGSLEADARFGVQFENLSTRPTLVTGVATVTSSSGDSAEFRLDGAADNECWSSSVYLEAPVSMSAEVIELGAAPYAVEVTVDLDGQRIEAPLFTWPEDFPENSNESARRTVDP